MTFWTKLKALRRDRSGVAAIEMAITLPVLVIMFNMVVNVAFILWEQASLYNAVGQASRFAMVYPAPDADAIEAKANDSIIGKGGNITRDVDVAEGTSDGRNYVEVTMTASMPIDFIFMEGPTVDLSQTRRTYITTPLAEVEAEEGEGPA